jgi:hypothetical protein
MKNKILMCVIVLVIAMINISCKSNNIVLETSLKDESEDTDDYKDYAKDESEDTDDYFVEKYSIYRNPIDKYFWSQIYSWDASQAEIREAQKTYKKAWKIEYRNMMKWLKKKCVYDEDKKNIKLLEQRIADQINIEKKVMETELINAYKTNPDSSQVQNSNSRISLLGHGTQERLAQSEGELYRDVCMRILNLHGDEGGYEFKFHDADY